LTVSHQRFYHQYVPEVAGEDGMRTRPVATFVIAGSLFAAACGASKSDNAASTSTTEDTTVTTVAESTSSTVAQGTGASTSTVVSTTSASAKPSSGAKRVITPTGKATSGLPPAQAPRSEVKSPATTEQQGEPPQPGGVLTAMVGFEGSGYDPARFSNASVSGDMHRLFAVYDALVFADPTTGAVLPELATTVTTNDAIVWTMKIRPNVKFTDGTTFDAQAVKFNWDRHADPANASSAVSLVKTLKYDVVDPLTLKITLPAANGQFPRVIAEFLPYIGSPAAIAAAGSQANYIDKPVGAGPFILKQWVRDSQATFVRNPGYWNAPRPYLDQLIIRTVTDETQRTNTMKAGEADVEYTNFPGSIQQLQAAGITVRVSPSLNTNVFYMNESIPALADVRVRRALQLAVDIDQLNKLVDSGVGEVPRTYFPANYPYTDPNIKFPPPDLTEAQKLIDAYVNENGGKDLQFEFTTSAAVRNQAYYQAMQNMIQKLNHVKMTLRTLDAARQLTAVNQRDFQLYMYSFQGTDPEPQFMEQALSTGSRQFAGYKNSDVDKNIATARSTTDANVRAEALKNVQKQMIADVPFFPLYRSTAYFAQTGKVRDLATFNDGSLLSDRIWLGR
jgi:peptide/nickel transport system substrate-binding protein